MVSQYTMTNQLQIGSFYCQLQIQTMLAHVFLLLDDLGVATFTPLYIPTLGQSLYIQKRSAVEVLNNTVIITVLYSVYSGIV